MATVTPNYGLTKPAGTDPVDISVLNTNSDIIDTALHDLDTGKQDAEDGMGLSQESFTTAEKEALALINAAFPFVVQRGEYTLNDQSELTFDTLADTKYYRYTASAIGNPVSGGYGIIINIRYTAYAVQLLFSQTTATAPTQLLYRIGTNMSTTPTWRDWQTVSTGSGGGGATIDTLWSDSNGATVGTEYTMTGRITDYDVIYLKCGNSDDITSNNDYVQTSFMPALIEQNENLSVECFYFKRYFRAEFGNNTFSVLNNASTDESGNVKPTIFKVIGLRY